jgi:hypothetical protein
MHKQEARVQLSNTVDVVNRTPLDCQQLGLCPIPNEPPPSSDEPSRRGGCAKHWSGSRGRNCVHVRDQDLYRIGGPFCG